MIDDHPIPVTESATLSCTPCPTPEYDMLMPSAHRKHLSPLQCRTVSASMHALLECGVFALGDGTGVGKGRTIAAVLYEWLSYHPDARVVWTSANQRIHRQSAEELQLLGIDEDDPRIAFASYSALTLPSRRAAIHRFLDGANATLVVADESHLLRKQRITYNAFETLLDDDTSVLYSSATMMSDPSHLPYLSSKMMLHSHPQAPFADPATLKQRLDAGGSAIMELVAMYLRSRGLYLCRQLSMDGVSVATHTVSLTTDQHKLYADAVGFLRRKHTSVTTTHQLMFRMLTAFKVADAIRIADALIARGQVPIFVFSTTGEASMERTLQQQKHAQHDNPSDAVATPRSYVAETLRRLGCPLELEQLLNEHMPLDPIDAILTHYGVDDVAEITGRSRRVVLRDGEWRVERVRRNDDIDALQSGEKNVGILSRAGGIGLSLHDNGSGRRHTLLVELPWSGEDLVQIMGRTHRAAGATVPEYTMCVTDVPCEMRVAYSLSRRVRNLGALTRADRTSCDQLSLHARFGDTTTTPQRRALVLKIIVVFILHNAPEARAVLQTHYDAFRNAAAIRWNAPAALYRRTWTPAASCVDRIIKDLNAVLMDEVEGLTHHMTTAADHLLLTNDMRRRWLPEECSDMRTTHLLACLACALLPELLLGGVIFWSPTNHHLFGKRAQTIATTLLLCHASTDTQTTLGLLPDAIILKILEHVLWEGDDLCVVAGHVASTSFTTASLLLLYARNHEYYLNSLMCMPIHVQHAMARAMHACGCGERTSAASPSPLTTATSQCVDIVDAVKHRAGSGVRVAQRHVDDEGDGILRVHFAYTPDVSPTPPADARYLKNIRSAVLCWTRPRNEHGTTVDGHPTTVHSSTHTPVPREAWDTSYSRRRRFLEHKCRRLAPSYRVSTHNALFHWDESLKTVVRVDNVVGLLLDC